MFFFLLVWVTHIENQYWSVILKSLNKNLIMLVPYMKCCTSLRVLCLELSDKHPENLDALDFFKWLCSYLWIFITSNCADVCKVCSMRIFVSWMCFKFPYLPCLFYDKFMQVSSLILNSCVNYIFIITKGKFINISFNHFCNM